MTTVKAHDPRRKRRRITFIVVIVLLILAFFLRADYWVRKSYI